MNTKEMLAALRTEKNYLKNLQEEIEDIREHEHNVTVTLLPETKKVSKRVEEIAIRLTALERQYEEGEKLLFEKQARMADVFRRMDTQYAIMLRLRYIEGLRWPEIIERLKGYGLYYSDRQIFNLHNRALQELDEIMRQGEDSVSG